MGPCRHGGEHHPHWGSIVGSVARGMRQVGLPLGRHHHTQHLDPERADAAAATRKQVRGQPVEWACSCPGCWLGAGPCSSRAKCLLRIEPRSTDMRSPARHAPQAACWPCWGPCICPEPDWMEDQQCKICGEDKPLCMPRGRVRAAGMQPQQACSQWWCMQTGRGNLQSYPRAWPALASTRRLHTSCSQGGTSGFSSSEDDVCGHLQACSLLHVAANLTVLNKHVGCDDYHDAHRQHIMTLLLLLLQAMEFLSRTSAANKAQCAEIESLVSFLSAHL